MAIYTRQYTQGVGWENEPSVNTPINAENLNQMDEAIQGVDSAVKNAFDAVETALANAGGNALSDHITSVGGIGNAYLITSTDIFNGQAPNDNDLLFLYSEVNAELSNLSLWWHVKFGTSGTIIGSIVDLRDGNSGSTYTGNISAGSVLILTKIPAEEAQDDWALRAIIPAAGGGGTTVIANPSGLPTLDLNKLMVADVIYAIHSGADVVIAETGTTDTTGYILDIDRSLAGIKAWDIVEIKVNANYTFQQSSQYSDSRSWGLSYAQSSWTVNNTLRCVESSDFLSAYFRPDLKKGDSILAICYAFELDHSPMLLVVGLFNASMPVIPTHIDHPQRGEILRYNDVRKTWENEKESANVIVLSTGTTDTTGHSIDIDVNIGAVEVGNVLEFRINANYTFSGGSSYNGWGVSYTTGGGMLIEEDNVLRRVSSGNSIYFDKDLKKGDSVFAVCTGFFDAVPNLLVVAVYNADGTALGDLNNVNISTPADGQYLKYNSTTSKWENASGGGGGGSSTLAGLDDTAISSPTAAQPLTYDATNSKWVNGGVIPTANGGTGNADGYIRTGQKANTTVGTKATIEGYDNTSSGNYSHTEGSNNKATGNGAHAEGISTEATSSSAHAEGNGCKATGTASHAENTSNTASGNNSHAGGNNSTSGGTYSFAHGRDISIGTNGQYAAGFGQGTVANYNHQFVAGKYNNNKSTSIFEVGIGTGTNARANGLELDGSGNLKTAGTITNGKGVTVGDADVLLPSTVGWTGKNELENSGTNTSIQTVVITANSDGSITLNGTATASNASYVIGHYTIKAGTHILSKTGVSNLKFQVTDYPVTTELYLAEMNDVTMTFAQDTAIAVRLSLISGTQYNNVTVYPMIRLATVTDSTYEPYHKSVEECLEEINDKLSYLETTATLSTSGTTTVTFTSAKLTTSSCVEIGVSEWGLVPDDVTVSTGSCTVTLPIVDSAHTVTVRLYVR